MESKIVEQGSSDKIVVKSEAYDRMKRYLALDEEFAMLGDSHAQDVADPAEAEKNNILQMLNKTHFNDWVSKAQYPSKLLGGPIALDHAEQRNGIDELNATLGNNPKIPEEVRSLIQALHQYFHRHFDTEGKAIQAKPKARSAKEAFLNNPSKGGDCDYQAFRQYRQALEQADAEQRSFHGLTNMQGRNIEFDALFLNQCKSEELKKHLLAVTPFNQNHSARLERFIDNNPQLAEECIDAAKNNAVRFEDAFIDAALADPAKREPMLRYLRDMNDEDCRNWIRRALDEDRQQLFAALLSRIVSDPGYFYLALQRRLSPEIFRKVVQSIMAPKSPQAVYGMDSTYAHKIISEQGESTSNVLTVLQKALPHGLDGARLGGFVHLMREFNAAKREINRIAESAQKLDQKNSRSISELSIRQGEAEAIRFITFNYIADRLKQKAHDPDALGLSHRQVAEFLTEQEEFESFQGCNPNILSEIYQLYQVQSRWQPRREGIS